MAQKVIIVEPGTIMKMKEFYEDDLQEKIPPGAIFMAKPLTCTITAYKSGKILFQGGRCEEEAAMWETIGNTKNVIKKIKEESKISNSPSVNFTQLSMIGTDEVGTGDYFGPITVVAAFVPIQLKDELTVLGVKDSKGMKDELICKVAKEIIKKIPYSLLILHNEKYNTLQQQGMNQGKMKALLHNKAILHLKQKLGSTPYDGILIDQFAERNVYFRYLTGQKEIVNEKNMYFYTKAESLHLSVAAASIIARYAFIKEMDKLSERAGFEIPKGAGENVDKAAAKLIASHGEEALNHYCKLHFANTNKAKKRL